jgi:predicted nucleic acid-binding protein
MIILDTNVISELMRPEPDKRVSNWVQLQKPFHLAISAITVAEIQRGLKRLPPGKKRSALESAFMSFIKEGFEGKVYSFDEDAAMVYGDIAFAREKAGCPVDAVDLMIAAICKSLDAAIATRNVKDFENCGIKIINPWTE